MCQTLDQDYPGMGVMGVVILGSKMKQIETPVNQQRNIINEQIGVVRNELRKAHAGEMLAVISKLNTSINKTFDYKKDKSLTELLDKLKHRVKR